MRSIKNLPTQDGYVDGLTLNMPRAMVARVDVANNAVEYQLDVSEDGHGLWGVELYTTPIVGTLDAKGSGIRFKSAVPGKPAQVSCVLLDEDEVTGLESISPSLFVVAADGSVARGSVLSVISHTPFTAPVSITATTEATANGVVVAPAFSADGTTSYLVEFFAPGFNPDPTAVADLYAVVFRNGSPIGRIVRAQNSATNKGYTAGNGRLRDLPPAGSVVYEVRAFITAAATGTINAGPGGANQYAPGFLRVTSD